MGDREAFEKFVLDHYVGSTAKTPDGLYYNTVAHPLLDREYSSVQMLWEAWREGKTKAGAEVDRLIRERDEARTELEAARRRREDEYARMLEWRGIDPGDECKNCGGSGVTTYGSTATWRGGVGGQTITTGVCDKCWGSGKKDRPWLSLRKLEAERQRARLPVELVDQLQKVSNEFGTAAQRMAAIRAVLTWHESAK